MSRLRRVFGVLLTLGLLAAGAAAAGAWWLWDSLHQPFRAYVGAEAKVLVKPGSSATGILAQLENEGVIKDARLARLFLIHHLKDPALKAGEYQFTEPMSTQDVLNKLIKGEVVTHPLTLIEGLTVDETAQAIADAGFGMASILRSEMDRVELIHDLDPAATNLEGYLYPDTYHFARGTTEKEIVATLVETFRRRFKRELQPLLGDWESVKGLDGLRDLVTLASIVEKETQLDDERGIVASVYRNRLRIKMGLYADPTLIYGKKLAGDWDGNLRRVDLKTDGPYNTYMRPGLPPSPICSPSIASMMAAWMPAETKYLYFVSRNDGTHAFAETRQEHDRNVYQWQKLYWRRRWAEERAAKAGAGT